MYRQRNDTLILYKLLYIIFGLDKKPIFNYSKQEHLKQWEGSDNLKIASGTKSIVNVSSSINLFWYGFYVLTGWLSGTREPVLCPKGLLVGVVGGE